MATTQRSTVVGVFNDRGRAEEAVHALRQVGFRDDQVSLVAQGSESDIRGRGTKAEGNEAGTGAAVGAAAGAGIASLTSLGITFGVIPVIGPILAVGPLAAALISAGGGAVAGGIIGGLIGLGIPEHEAKYYEGEVKAGRTLVTVRANGRYDEAWSIMQRYGAYNQQTAAATTTSSTTGHTAATGRTATTGRTAGSSGEQTMQVREEELHARKTPVETGEVRVRKDVVTEQQNISVPVQREEVVIERRPASGKASAGDLRPGEEVRIPVKEEKVRVEKDTVVKEEVHVGKRQVQDTEQVSGTVRKEQVKVEKEGDVDVRGNVPPANKKRK